MAARSPEDHAYAAAMVTPPRRIRWMHAPEGARAVLALDPVVQPPKASGSAPGLRYRVGRRDDLCDLCLPLDSVGRQHAFITERQRVGV